MANERTVVSKITNVPMHELEYTIHCRLRRKLLFSPEQSFNILYHSCWFYEIINSSENIVITFLSGHHISLGNRYLIRAARKRINIIINTFLVHLSAFPADLICYCLGKFHPNASEISALYSFIYFSCYER